MPESPDLLVYRHEDWPHGLRCGRCSRLFEPGDIYAEDPEGFIDDIPQVLIVCGLGIGCRRDDDA